MNKFFKILSENEILIKISLIIYSLYCALIVGMSWDEVYYHKIGEINLNYLLSFGLVEESFDQKFRFSTLYWSLSSLLSQIAPQKYSVEAHHIINALLGLMIFVGVYQVTKKIFNKSVAKTSALFLFLLQFFFGHLAINNKDIIITFAHVWIIFYLIKYSVKKLNLRNKIIVLLKISVLSALGTGIQLLFLGSLTPILIIFLVYLIILKKRKIREILIDLIIYFIFFYLILVLFWVDTHSNIFILPFSFLLDSFSLDVGWPFNLTNNKYTFSREVTSFYLLINYFYKLPEFIIFLYLVTLPVFILNYKKLKEKFDNFSLKILLLTTLLIFPHLIIIFIKYPIYDGLRLFLWATPYLVIIPSITFYSVMMEKKSFFLVTKVILFFLFALHLYNFIKFTPYHYTYLNYLSGEANKGYQKFENDYWSISLKELILSSNLKDVKINFSVCGVNASVAKIYMKQKYKNVEYVGINKANYVIMTNRTLYSEKNKSISNCYDEYDFQNVAEVKRNGLILSAIKKIR